MKFSIKDNEIGCINTFTNIYNYIFKFKLHQHIVTGCGLRNKALNVAMEDIVYGLFFRIQLRLQMANGFFL